MRYLSVCSGIEAATVAWHPLGWTPAAFSEIEAFPRAVLAHHYPEVPLEVIRIRLCLLTMLRSRWLSQAARTAATISKRLSLGLRSPSR